MRSNLKSLPLNQATLNYLENIFFDSKEDEAWRKRILNILQNHGYPSHIKTTLDYKLIAYYELACGEENSQVLEDNFDENYDGWASELPHAKRVMKELPARFKSGEKITLNEEFIACVTNASNRVSSKEEIAKPAGSAGEYWRKGIEYNALGKWKDSLACYNKATELGGNRHPTFIASALIRLKRKAEAIQVYKEALAKTDDYGEWNYITYRLACLDIQKKDYESAMARFLAVMVRCEDIVKTVRMDNEDKKNIETTITFKNGNKIDTILTDLFYDLIIRIVSKVEKVAKKQLWENQQFQKRLISSADSILFKLEKWIKEAKQRNAGVDRHENIKRELFRVHFRKPSEVPTSFNVPSKYFGCFLYWNVSGVTNKVISRVARNLLKAGCVYFSTWGKDCERVHDIIDHVDFELNPDQDDDFVIMTTWHSHDSLEYALWYFLNVADPDNGYADNCRAAIAISIDGAPKSLKMIDLATRAPRKIRDIQSERSKKYYTNLTRRNKATFEKQLKLKNKEHPITDMKKEE